MYKVIGLCHVLECEGRVARGSDRRDRQATGRAPGHDDPQARLAYITYCPKTAALRPDMWRICSACLLSIVPHCARRSQPRRARISFRAPLRARERGSEGGRKISSLQKQKDIVFIQPCKLPYAKSGHTRTHAHAHTHTHANTHARSRTRARTHTDRIPRACRGRRPSDYL